MNPKQHYRQFISNILPDDALRARAKEKVLRKQASGRSKGEIPLFRPVFPAVAVGTLALVMVFGFLFFGRAGHSGGVSETAKSTQAFSGFVLTAYAANDSYSQLTPSYAENATAARVKPGAEVLLPEYSPLMSSVPGFPFRLDCGQPGEADRILIGVDQGEILTWTPPAGKVEIRGKADTCRPGDTVYWAPLEKGSAVGSDTVLTLTALKGGTEVGKQQIIIRSVGQGKYAVALR